MRPSVTNSPVFQCVECGRTRPLTEIVYRCECGGLLEVKHDLASARGSAKDWRALFDARWGAREGPDASGVWRYRELVLPDLTSETIVSMPEGSTRARSMECCIAAFFRSPDIPGRISEGKM